ncbi:MAG: hypothetical protein NTW65_08035 [Deltaproteobacteria bacterium]|nr:hypothetical protein [Deltaproteobacteria bacterium]
MKKTNQKKFNTAMPVIAASYIGPALTINSDALWEEDKLPLNTDGLVNEVMGQPMRRAGRFIKMVCCGGLSCLQKVSLDYLKGKKTGIFLSTGLGNVDEIMPFITQVFKHGGGFPSPNQFANSVSNAAAFVLARICEVTGTVLTISQEELSFESALWLAQSYLESDEIELALVGGCDIFTPTVEEYRERVNLTPDNSRAIVMGESSSWLLLGKSEGEKIGDILAVDFGNKLIASEEFSKSENILSRSEKLISASFSKESAGRIKNRFLLPGFRVNKINAEFWKQKGWKIDDYLPFCGIHSTAAAFGIARALREKSSSLFVHYNCHASGKQVLVLASTE